MKSASAEILKSWYQLLNGNVSYDGTALPVYRITTDINANSHYILLQADSESDFSTTHFFGKDFLLKVTIVTRQYDQVNDEILDSIDTQINNLLYPDTWGNCSIKSTTNFQIPDILPQSANYIAAQIEQNRYYLKETLYRHRIIEQ